LENIQMNTDIGTPKGTAIVGTVSTEPNAFAQLLQIFDQKLLLLRRHPRKNLTFLKQLKPNPIVKSDHKTRKKSGGNGN
jgi:hypothetical protein